MKIHDYTVLYGRGIPSIAEQLGKTVKEAQNIYDSVLAKFEGLAKFLEASEDMAREYGYTVTKWGRRRQLKDMRLPYYEFGYKNGFTPDFDPLSDDSSDVSTEVPIEIVEVLTNKLLNCWGYKKREELKERIRQKGYTIKDNTTYIKRAQRQCVNSRVQGSSADLTKLAQIELYNNEELKKLGFRMLIPVHDEIIAECPEENVKRCSELMSKCMLDAGKDLCVPLSCDVAVFKSWYGKELDPDAYDDMDEDEDEEEDY
jgi:DNA polymerase I-like protein with 3'-5' exonuclease and polymerase domains